MTKEKYKIGEIIGDFTLLEKNKNSKNRILYKIKCNICGDIREIMNLTNKQTQHNIINCKNTYVKSFIGNKYNDYICIDAYIDRRLFLVLKCDKCGIERIVAEKDLKRFNNSHGYTCTRNLIKLLDNFDQAIFHRLQVKYKNIIYRTTNPKYHHYETYNKLGCDYKYFCDFALDYYDDYYKACKELGINNVYIDRIDNSKGYIYGNIRFVNAKRSAINRTTQTYFECNNKVYYSAMDFSKEYNISHSYISRELSKINVGETFNFRGHIIKKIS